MKNTLETAKDFNQTAANIRITQSRGNLGPSVETVQNFRNSISYRVKGNTNTPSYLAFIA